MKFISRLAIAFYVVFTMFIGITMLMFVMNWLGFEDAYQILFLSYHYTQMRLIIGISALILLYVNFIFAGIISDRRQKEKTIAFDNPSGRVIVSLSAIEDLVKRSVSKNPSVKDAKAEIYASKRGMEIGCKIVLNADINIPELTSKLQEQVKNKVQEIIGIEETVQVKVHVAKILPEESKVKPAKTRLEMEEETESTIPFHGYRA